VKPTGAANPTPSLDRIVHHHHHAYLSYCIILASHLDYPKPRSCLTEPISDCTKASVLAAGTAQVEARYRASMAFNLDVHRDPECPATILLNTQSLRPLICLIDVDTWRSTRGVPALEMSLCRASNPVLNVLLLCSRRFHFHMLYLILESRALIWKGIGKGGASAFSL
jgi:hypothetical protein